MGSSFDDVEVVVVGLLREGDLGDVICESVLKHSADECTFLVFYLDEAGDGGVVVGREEGQGGGEFNGVWVPP